MFRTFTKLQTLILVTEHMTHSKDKHAQWFFQNYYSVNIVTSSKRIKETLILAVCISYDALSYLQVKATPKPLQNNSFKQQRFSFCSHCMSITEQWWYAMGSSILYCPLSVTEIDRDFIVGTVVCHSSKNNSSLV